ncbi:16S rRNA (cytosine(967)-C(5))-methyltransferase RsmB [Pontibacter sp. JAM-7]|uniref:16S rRNA (cytosine(967)-C(5))-methyltransferase RsmB n=1 Tax=Pontibacter sp. JAM-7 TaxID=3366581 RepID=UPI003AF82579
MADNVRLLAIQILTPLLSQRGSLRTHLAALEPRCAEQDRGLLRELCFGTLRYLPQLDLILETLLRKPFQQKDLDLQALLLVGLYQLRHTRIPPHACLNETVQCSRLLNKEWAGKLINAILRRYQREQAEIEAALETEPAFRFNHPQWMVAKLQNNWPEHWQQILQQNTLPAPLTLRVNLAKISREDYQQQLTTAGIAATPTDYSQSGLKLAESCAVTGLPGFAEGWFSVQDEAAQLAGQLLDLQPGQRVLDACAAPGGKLCHLLETAPVLAQIDAVELEANRAKRISENLARLQLQARLIIGDAASQDWWDGQTYDRILLDAPCSATGVIRRNPDIKLLRRGEDIHQLAQLQEKILDNCWKMLKPGGKLLYATCSVFPQENERQIQRFLARQGDAALLPLPGKWGLQREAGRQLLPQANGHDGFYYAMLAKTG